MIEQAKCSEQDIEALNEKVEKAMEEAVEFAKNSPEPSVEKFLQEVEQN